MQCLCPSSTPLSNARASRCSPNPALLAPSLQSYQQSLLTALLPPALLWLLCVLPSSYRSFLLRLWGYDPACKAGGFGGTASADSASPSSVTSPIAAALTWLIAQLHLTGLVSALADELALAARALYLCMLFLPALVTAPLASLGGAAARERWLRLVQWTLENAGPAFIKWGQWASTRPDLFPEVSGVQGRVQPVVAVMGCFGMGRRSRVDLTSVVG